MSIGMKTSYIDTKKIGCLILMGLSVPVSVFVCMGLGTVEISPLSVIRILFTDKESVNYQILYNIRLPRILVAVFVGMSLSISGTILQGVLRNPLAAPNIIGVSSGAGLSGFIILILFPELSFLVPAGAFTGAMAATTAVYFLAWNRGIDPFRMILAGVAVSSLLGAGMSSLMIFYPDRVHGVLSFMVGGLSARSWDHLRMILPYSLVGIGAAMFFATKLNILNLGDEVAVSLGIRLESTRFLLIAIASLLAASAVSVVGLLGFVGLIVPHIARKIIGPDNRMLFPASLACGATTLVVCDTIGRILLDPVEIPVGIIMAFLGAPFFLFLLRRRI